MTARVYNKICINCPAGCHLEITQDDEAQEGDVCVKGNRCPRGAVYAKQELTDPRRIVTAVAIIKSGSRQICIPVKTSAPLPKLLIQGLLDRICGLQLALPVHAGEVLIRNYCETGIDVVATDSALNP